MGNDVILIGVMRGGSFIPHECWLAILLGVRITACSCSFNYITMVRFRITKKGLIASAKKGREARGDGGDAG